MLVFRSSLGEKKKLMRWTSENMFIYIYTLAYFATLRRRHVPVYTPYSVYVYVSIIVNVNRYIMIYILLCCGVHNKTPDEMYRKSLLPFGFNCQRDWSCELYVPNIITMFHTGNTFTTAICCNLRNWLYEALGITIQCMYVRALIVLHLNT